MIGLSDGSLYNISWKGEVCAFLHDIATAMGVLSSSVVSLSDVQTKLLDAVCNVQLTKLSIIMQFGGAFFLDLRLNDKVAANNLSNHLSNGVASGGIHSHAIDKSNHVGSQDSGVVHLEYSSMMRLLFVLFSNGELMLFSVSKKGLKHTEAIRAERSLTSSEVVCISVAPEQQILAVGTRKGTVELYDLADSAKLIRSVSLYDWG